MEASPGKSRTRSSFLRIPDRPPRWLVPVAFALTALPFALQIPNDLVIGYDAMKYVVTARSIYEGTGLETGAPVSSQYPPGWPMIMAILFCASGWKPIAAHVLTSVLCWALGPLVYLYARRRTNPWIALALGVYFGAHFLTVRFGDQICSDPAFGVALWSLLLLAGSKRPANSFLRGLLLGALAAALTSLRTVGLAVWAGLLAGAVVRRMEAPAGEESPGEAKATGWKTRCAELAGLAAPMAAYLLMLSAWSPAASVRTGSGYGSQFFTMRIEPGQGLLPGIISRTLGDAYYHLRDARVAMLPADVGNSLPALVPKVLVICVLLLAAAGCFRQMLRRREVYPWITASYLSLCFIWPYFSARFIWPVVPLLVLHAASLLFPERSESEAGTEPAGRLIHLRKWGSVSLAAVLAAAAVSALTASWLNPRPQREEITAQRNAFRDAVGVISLGGGTVATIDTWGVYYYRREVPVCPLSWIAGPEQQLSRMRQSRAAWLLGAEYTSAHTDQLVARHPEMFEPVLIRKEVSLYRVLPLEPADPR